MRKLVTFKEMFPSQTQRLQQNNCKCKKTKTTHILTGVVAKGNIEELSKYLQSTWYGIATDGNSDETD